MSARLMHQPPAELGFKGKTLQYLEQAAAHWVMRRSALVLMVPTLGFDAEVERRRVSLRQYVDLLDGLVMQGGADVSPTSYGQQPLRPEWSGDPVRDRYEIELIEGFLEQGKPVFGICRGAQLLNVFFGGTLYQDIATLREDAQAHVDRDAMTSTCTRCASSPARGWPRSTRARKAASSPASTTRPWIGWAATCRWKPRPRKTASSRRSARAARALWPACSGTRNSTASTSRSCWIRCR